ncbi:beta-lactamase family protein [Paenibacillus sp. sptzw28]|uniref:serine hydrolase domain-containing protein n=1 Tax=Paenibacillus sp. sptzw28 TaxID=715179 RepID=UPI001C6EEC57|nr:serine hydrolase domain-containing protein [Paenibacillus sp. sptzw28]QYR22503.1 beta-lactamase family protein [Paenibacillus sp. sptzw28]
MKLPLNVWQKGFGKSGNGQPVTTSTPFAIASLSKSITALAVMQLVEAGKINLDASITNYIPSFQMDDTRGSKITVRQLLNQTSGLTDAAFPEMAFRQQPNTLEESLARLKTVKLSSDPGQQFHYYNPNYQILAWLVEEVSQESYAEYLKRHIFQPLQMDHTVDVATTKQFTEAADNFASGHIFLYGKPVIKKEPDWFIEGAAGNISTAEDMAHWLMLQLNGGTYRGVRLLSGEGIRAMHAAPAGMNSNYGMGWVVDEHKVTHNGLLWTYYAHQVLIPESGIGVVVLFNSGLNMLVDYSSFAQGITEILEGKIPEKSYFSGWNLEIIIALLTVVTVAVGIRSLLRLRKWEEKYRKRAKWLTWLNILLAFIPLVLLISLPQVMSFIAGQRVLNWERIFLIMPSVCIWLILASLFNMVNVIRRVSRMYRIYRDIQR